MDDQLTIIVAPPPTPNGDLHVGHLSGPYLGADVLQRYIELRNGKKVTALGVDLHQSYVVTMAERLGEDPLALARRSHQEISSTLASAAINFDIVGMPDGTYSRYVADWFRRLFSANVFRFRHRDLPFDVLRRRFLFESYASGYCPICISATKANICEACGHPNEAQELLSLSPTGGTDDDPIEMRRAAEYYIDLEEYRGPLAEYLRDNIPEMRPALSRLVSELFSKRLPIFPITFPSSWGIPAPFPDAEGLVLNVWAEMVPGHYHWIDRARVAGNIMPSRNSERYVQYLGFDNSFFYVFAHLGLALAARQAGIEALLPSAFVTNEFYLLENFKFSTSQGHLIWGRDLLSELPADEVRFYLAWSNPEYNQANFSRIDLDRVLNRKFRRPLERIIDGLLSLAGEEAAQSDHQLTMLARFEAAYDIRRPSLRIAALTVSSGFELLETLLKRRANPPILRGIAQALSCGLAPIACGAATRIWDASRAKGPLRWPSEA